MFSFFFLFKLYYLFLPLSIFFKFLCSSFLFFYPFFCQTSLHYRLNKSTNSAKISIVWFIGFFGAANYDDLRRLISTFFYLPFSTYSAPFFIDVFSYYPTALNDFLRRRFSSFFDGIISIYSTKQYLRTLNGTAP